MFSSLVDRYFSTEGFMPHGMCYLWQPGVLTLNIVSDGLITLAYFSIPFSLVYFVRKRRDLRFNWIFVAFAIFIVACGFTHVMEIATIWYPRYWLAGSVKGVTAAASVATSILLIQLMPAALRLPSPAALQSAIVKLENEVGERVRVEEELRRLNATLEARVADRTLQLETINGTLIEDNARFAMAADAAGLGFWDLDLKSNQLKWDNWMFRLYGRSESLAEEPETILAGSMHPDDRATSERAFTDTMSGGREFSTQFRIMQPSGAVRHLRSTARVARDSAGRAIRMFGVDVDITELQRADERFRLAIDAAPTGMLLMNLTGSIVLVNAQIEHLFGYSRGELLGQSIEMLVPARFREHHPDFRARFFAAPKARAMGAGKELYGLRKDGSEMPVEIALNPLHTSEGEFVLSSIVDLSQRLEIERLRTDFVSTVSHELRTPLTSISGSLGLLQAGAMGVLPEKAAAMIRIAYKNSGRLVRIINDILDIGKLEAGQLTLRTVSLSLADFLGQAIEANAAYAEQYGVRFILDGGPDDERVMADPDRLMQVVTNLLSNAAKFSRPGADVLIRVRPGSTTMRLEVEDTGPGIPEAFQGRIFEKFAQADASPTRRFEGTGLGLSIARQLVQAMGGTIGFSTVVGQGTIFYLELPRSVTAAVALRKVQLSDLAARRALSAAAGAMGMDTGGPVPRVLYVEDDEDLISVIGATLAGKAHIVPAHNLRDAERLLRGETFDMVVLDQALPDGDGLSLVDRVPGLIQFSVPIVLLVTDVPSEVSTSVAEVLVKSQVSAAQVAATILCYLPRIRS
jgi:PAS domain S-box-containing protein